MNDGTGKGALRRHLKALRDGLAEEHRVAMDAAIARATIALPAYRNSPVICAYASFGTEVSTRAIIEDAWRRGKCVVLPRCIPGTRCMDWYRVDSFEGLERSPMGIEEPPANPARVFDAFDAETVALVPGLTFEPAGFRMGYGGGFYDTFLQEFPGVSVGLCRTTHLSKHVPYREMHDLPVNLVVTDGPVFGR